MKKKLMPKSDLTQKFNKEMIEGKKMNYLVGGDGNGGQGSTPPPDW
jgi:hypothetical protein